MLGVDPPCAVSLRKGRRDNPGEMGGRVSSPTFVGRVEELDVLELVAAGRSNRQIGEELFITPKTAGLHVSRILAKLGVAGRGEAAAVAHRLRIGR